MKPLYTRLICRAHNRFSPSLFLRQHLGVLERPFPHHHRLLSTAANAPSNEPLDVRDDTPPPETGESAPPVMAGASEKASHPLRIKKMKTVAGDAMLPNKKFASIRKHKAKQNKLQEAGRNAPSQLLLHHTSGDYVGVVVEPMSANGSLTKIHYPWVVDDVVGIDGAQRSVRVFAHDLIVHMLTVSGSTSRSSASSNTRHRTSTNSLPAHTLPRKYGVSSNEFYDPARSKSSDQNAQD